MPRFSIVLPSKDRPDMLPKAVNSIMQQTFTDWELLLSLSGDYSAVALPPDSRTKFIQRGEGDSYADAVNRLINSSSGEIINCAADDDLMQSNALEIVDHKFKDSGAEWLYGKIHSTMGLMGRVGTREQLLKENFVPLPSTFWTQHAWLVTGEFDPTIKFAQDYDYWLRLWENFEPAFVSDVLVEYGVHDKQAYRLNITEGLAETEAIRRKYA